MWLDEQNSDIQVSFLSFDVLYKNEKDMAKKSERLASS